MDTTPPVWDVPRMDQLAVHCHQRRWAEVRDAILAGCPLGYQHRAGGLTLLHLATDGCDLPTVLLALQHGADPNAPDQQGGTPLMDAAWSGTADIMRALIAAGGDVTVVDGGGETLAIALVKHGQGREDPVLRLRVLLEQRRLDLGRTCAQGRTAEEWARAKGAHGLADMIAFEVCGCCCCWLVLLGFLLQAMNRTSTNERVS